MCIIADQPALMMGMDMKYSENMKDMVRLEDVYFVALDDLGAGGRISVPWYLCETGDGSIAGLSCFGWWYGNGNDSGNGPCVLGAKGPGKLSGSYHHSGWNGPT